MGRKSKKQIEEEIEYSLKLRDDPTHKGPLSPALRKKYEKEQDKINYTIWLHTH